MTNDFIRVILADDHVVVRAGLRAVLGAAKDIEIIGEARNGREAVTMAERFQPDVVVMDLDMPDTDGVTATKEIVAKGLAARVLVLTMHAEEDYLVPLLEAAAARVLAKNLTKKDPAAEERARFEKLTQREQDVLKYVAQGYSAPEIGERLFISPKTVDTYKQRIQEKLGLAHRSDYVQLALRLGLLSES
jgi:DNA-binding NarL/FixJ family response regulator